MPQSVLGREEFLVKEVYQVEREERENEKENERREREREMK